VLCTFDALLAPLNQGASHRRMVYFVKFDAMQINIAAKQIIRRTISENEEANPFSDDFNLEKLHELFKLDLAHYFNPKTTSCKSGQCINTSR